MIPTETHTLSNAFRFFLCTGPVLSAKSMNSEYWPVHARSSPPIWRQMTCFPLSADSSWPMGGSNEYKSMDEQVFTVCSWQSKAVSLTHTDNICSQYDWSIIMNDVKIGFLFQFMALLWEISKHKHCQQRFDEDGGLLSVFYFLYFFMLK